jgi:DNA-binding NtrC family response regulator
MMITAYGTIQTAVEAVKRGVFDYVPKPFTPEELRVTLHRAVDKIIREREHTSAQTVDDERTSLQSILGQSPEMQKIFKILRHAALSSSNVLITGESGTGKELVAHAIHDNSGRARRQFVTINCGAIPEGLLESELFGFVRGAFTGAAGDKKGLLETADRGTLFLDEIGELAIGLQVKLLRVIQKGEFHRLGDPRPRTINIRIIAATNRDLQQAIEDGLFRQDLYYRLNVIPIELPPLRDRKEDITVLVDHFLIKHNPRTGAGIRPEMAPEAMHALVRYDYPGNVRELENIIQYALAVSSTGQITVKDLPTYLKDIRKFPSKKSEEVTPLKEAKHRFEKEVIISALVAAGGNVSEAARRLNIHRQNLQQKIKLLDIDIDRLLKRR